MINVLNEKINSICGGIYPYKVSTVLEYNEELLIKGVSELHSEADHMSPFAGEAAQQRCLAAGAAEGLPCRAGFIRNVVSDS